MQRKVLVFLLALVMVVTMVPMLGVSAATTYTMTAVYNSGNYGVTLAEGDKVTISSAEELGMLATYTNAGQPTANLTFILNADVTLNAGSFTSAGAWVEADGTTAKSGTPVAFTPIGTEANPFAGDFVADGHIISGLYISTTVDNVGLFGYMTSTACLHSVVLENIYVSGGDNVGGLVGMVDGTDPLAPAPVHAAKVSGVVKGSNLVGGIVGRASVIRLCESFNAAEVTGTNAIGGLIGGAEISANIYNCYNNGKVTGDSFVGGVSGIITAGSIRDCVTVGTVSGVTDAVGAVVGDVNTTTLSNCYYLAGSAKLGEAVQFGIGNTDKDTEGAVHAKSTENLKNIAVMNALNKSAGANEYSRAWTRSDAGVILSDNLVVATVTVGTDVYRVSNLADAMQAIPADATAETGVVVKILRNLTSGAVELGGTYTLDLAGSTVRLSAPATFSMGRVTITDSSGKRQGTLIADSDAPILMQGGSVYINAGNIFSKNGDYSVRVEATSGVLYFSNSPVLNKPVYAKYANTICGNDGAAETPKMYVGSCITVYCDWAVNTDSVIVFGMGNGQFTATNYNEAAGHTKIDKYTLTTVNGELKIVEITQFSWLLLAIIIGLAAFTVILCAIYAKKIKKRLKGGGIVFFLIVVVALVALAFVLPYLTNSDNNLWAFILGGVVLLVCLIYCIVSILSLKKRREKKEAAAKEEPKKEAAPAVVEIPPVVEEAPVKEEVAPVVEDVPPVVEDEAPVKEEIAPVVEDEAPVVEDVPPVVEDEAPVKEEIAPVVEDEAPVVEDVPPAKEEEEVVVPPVVTDGDGDGDGDGDDDGDDDGDGEAAPLTDASGNVVYSMYKKSFTARMIQAPTDVRDRYVTLKNALLAYKKVNARLSWSYESFKMGHKQLAKFAIRGKTLCLFLAIDPESLGTTKYNITNVGDSKKYAGVPCRLRLTSPRSVKWGLELIAKLAENEQLVPNPKYKPSDYQLEEMTLEEMLEKGLVKKV